MSEHDIDVETVRPLEALHRAAERLDAVMLLTSSADLRNVLGRRFIADEPGARLLRLAVARSQPDTQPRVYREVLIVANVEELTIDEAATSALAGLAPILRNAA